MNRLIILDRDGVINEDSDHFIKSVDEFVPIEGSLEAMARLCGAGYRIAIATNQSGIARGYYDHATLAAMHAKLRRLLKPLQGEIACIAYCPHAPDEGCECRKPRSGLLRQIAAQLGYDLHGVPVVGDSLRDLEAARRVGAQPVLVLTGKGERTLAQGQGLEGIPRFTSLACYVHDLLESI